MEQMYHVMIACVSLNDGDRAPCFTQNGYIEAITFVLSTAEMNGHVFSPLRCEIAAVFG